MSTEEWPEGIAAVICGRRTIEKFRQARPPQEMILRGIEVACWAPNHKHTEPWRFHLLGPESTDRLVELNTEIIRQSMGDEAAVSKRERWSRVPGWLALTCDLSDDPLRAEEDYAACCCAAQNLALYLWSHGLGMKWSTGAVTRTDEFAQLLGLSPGERKIVGLYAYGYPEAIPQSRRRPLAEVIDVLP